MYILENYLPVAIGLLVATFITFLVKETVLKKTYNGKKIPSPKGAYPFFGHFFLIKGRVGLVFSKWHKELGPIFYIKMGVKNWVLISDPEALQEILVRQGLSTSARPNLTFFAEVNSPNNSGIAFSTYSKKWKNVRNTVLSILSPKSVESLSEIMSNQNQSVVNMMIRDGRNNEAVEVYEYSKLAGISLMASTSYAIPFLDGLTNPIFKRLRYLVRQAMEFSSLSEDYREMFPILKLLDPTTRNKKKMIEFRDKELHSYIRELIEFARKSNDDSLVKKIDRLKEKYELDDQNFMSIMSESLFVGAETTSSAVSWAIATLCHYPEVQKKAFDELNSFIKKNQRQPKYLDKDDLPYFFATIKECLRYRLPIELASPHVVTEDVFYKNYLIPKGYIVYVNMHTINNDPSLFPNPEKFDPERFMNDNRSIHSISNGKLEHRNIYGFGWGRRICPGIYMTENYMFCLLSKILAACAIEPETLSSGENLYPDLDKTLDTGFSIGPRPFKVRLIEREGRAIV